jgi:glycosyltransferase involved in cell wall biosynthesis
VLSRRHEVGHSPVALAHDYLTQRGGAERVVLMMAEAFPEAPLYTTLYEPSTTWSGFEGTDVRVSPLNRASILRRHHRLALPLLAPAVSSTRIDAAVTIASSSGWAHGVRTAGRKVVYCHAPARWLYQSERYLGAGRADLADQFRLSAAQAALGLLGGAIRRWDQRAAMTAHRYLVNSTATRDAVSQAYGIDSEVLSPPPALLPDGDEHAMPGLESGALLCVARLLPYKNVDLVIQAVQRTRALRLIVAGDGPERAKLERLAGTSAQIHFVGRVSDPQLRWLYRHCGALIAASYEDYGLSPLEAAGFERPTVALRAGGYLDTVVEGRTGAFFDQPTVESISSALESFDAHHYSADILRSHAAAFSKSRFLARLRQVVNEEAGQTPCPPTTA